MLSFSQNSKDFFSSISKHSMLPGMINSLIFQLNAQIQYPQGIVFISERNILLEDLAVGRGR